MANEDDDIWEIDYISVEFFEKVLKTHNKIESFTKSGDNCFQIVKDDYSELKVILVDRYVLSLADILQAIEDFGEFDCIVTCANWNSYTKEAKEWGLKNHKGVFVVGEFSGALWSKNMWKYVKKDNG
jgi:hypothetical protein